MKCAVPAREMGPSSVCCPLDSTASAILSLALLLTGAVFSQSGAAVHHPVLSPGRAIPGLVSSGMVQQVGSC